MARGVRGAARFLLSPLRGSAYVTQQRLSWIVLATLLGWLASLPFAPPWDGETRILAATLPFFYLLPTFSVSAFALLASKWTSHETTRLSEQKPSSVALSSGLASAFYLIVIFAPLWFIGARGRAKPDPVLQATKKMAGNDPPTAIDLSSLSLGYRLRVVANTKTTWFPDITQADLIKSAPRGSYMPLSVRFEQLPPGTQIITLPYWVLLVVDPAEAAAGRFVPAAEQTGHAVWPQVYFSAGLEHER